MFDMATRSRFTTEQWRLGAVSRRSNRCTMFDMGLVAVSRRRNGCTMFDMGLVAVSRRSIWTRSRFTTEQLSARMGAQCLIWGGSSSSAVDYA
eukprot:g3876.t1